MPTPLACTAQPSTLSDLASVGDDNVSCNRRVSEYRGQLHVGDKISLSTPFSFSFLSFFLAFVLEPTLCHRAPCWLLAWENDLFHNQRLPQLFDIATCQPTHFGVHSGRRRWPFSLSLGISPVDPSSPSDRLRERYFLRAPVYTLLRISIN